MAYPTPGAKRERLPNRRSGEIREFDHGGFHYVAGVGRFDDGRLGEIFLSAAKSGTVIEAWARDSAIVASLCLQAGISPETIRHALSRDHDGSPSSPLCRLLDLLAGGRAMNPVAATSAPEPPSDRVLLELRCAWLRLELAQVEITWAGQALRSGHISARGALHVLDEALGIESELDESAP